MLLAEHVQVDQTLTVLHVLHITFWLIQNVYLSLLLLSIPTSTEDRSTLRVEKDVLSALTISTVTNVCLTMRLSPGLQIPLPTNVRSEATHQASTSLQNQLHVPWINSKTLMDHASIVAVAKPVSEVQTTAHLVLMVKS
jgi:hypothetical protein